MWEGGQECVTWQDLICDVVGVSHHRDTRLAATARCKVTDFQSLWRKIKTTTGCVYLQFENREHVSHVSLPFTGSDVTGLT